jgi:hypothetical protein
MKIEAFIKQITLASRACAYGKRLFNDGRLWEGDEIAITV